MKQLKDFTVTKTGAIAEISGHKYRLYNVENDDYQTICFFQNLPNEIPNGMKATLNGGTTVEETLRVVLDRLDFMYNTKLEPANIVAKALIEEALSWLNEDL